MAYDIVTIVITVLFIGFIFYKILPTRGVKQITVDELRPQLKEKDVQLIDVRPPAKYNQFHIYGFKNIPLRDIRKEAKQLDKNKKTILICQTGTKGNEASKRLKRRGFKNLANVRGGLSTWDPVHIDRT